MNIPAILAHLRPGEEWTLNGDSMDGLTWLSDTAPPTVAEVEAAWPDVEAAEAQAEADRIAAREAAIAKLAALGLTVDDLTALGL